MSSGDFCELTIENFLVIGHFQAKITPMVILYGDNGSGKTILVKLLYAMQEYYSIARDRNTRRRQISRDRARRQAYNRIISKENSNSEDSHDQEALYDIFIKHINDRNGLSILEDFQDFFLTYLSHEIVQQFSNIPRYFGYQEWGNLIGNSRDQQECVFFGTNSKFHGKVTIRSDGERVLVEPDLRLCDSQEINLSISFDQDLEQIDGESMSGFLSELWDDPIFSIRSIILSIQQNEDDKSEKFEISIPIRLYEEIVFSCLKDSGLELEGHDDGHSDVDKKDGRVGVTRRRLGRDLSEDLRRSISKYSENKNLEKSIKFRLLNEFMFLTLKKLGKQLPFNLFPNTEPLFFPPGRMQIMLDFDGMIGDSVQDSMTGFEIRDFITSVEGSIISKKDSNNIDLLAKLGQMQGDISLKEIRKGKLIFYNERTKKELFADQVPSSTLSLTLVDILLSRVRLNPKRATIFFEEIGIHLHPSNIEEFCKLIVELCLMDREDEEKNENLRTGTNMIITTHSFHVLFFLLSAVGSIIHPQKVKDYYTPIRLELSKDYGNTKCKIVDLDEEGYLIDPYIDEDISIDRGMRKWIRKWKEPIKSEVGKNK